MVLGLLRKEKSMPSGKGTNGRTRGRPKKTKRAGKKRKSKEMVV